MRNFSHGLIGKSGSSSMTKKRQWFSPVYVKAIDLLKKNASTDNRSANQVKALAADDVSLQEKQADNEQ